METLASPWIFSCSLGCLCLTSLALALLVVRDVQVKECVTHQNQELTASVGSRTRTVSYRVTLARESH